MAILYYKGGIIRGLSTDTKPADVPVNTLFIETNTKRMYLYDGTDWNELIYANPAGVTDIKAIVLEAGATIGDALGRRINFTDTSDFDITQNTDDDAYDIKIADDAIEDKHIADNSIANAHMKDNSVDTPEIVNLAVTSDKLAGSIEYSKLTLLDSIINTDINSAAAIAYSKLNLATSIVNADISTSAAIAYSKLNLTTSIVNGDISTSAAIAYSKLSLSNSIVNADINSSAAIAYSKLNLTTSIVDGDIAASGITTRSKLPSALAYEDEANSFTATQTINKASQAGVAELLAEFKVSDQASSYVRVINASATDAVFLPRIAAYNAGNLSAALSLFGYIDTAQDSGSTPIMVFDSRHVDDTAITTRPLFDFRNLGTSVLAINLANITASKDLTMSAANIVMGENTIKFSTDITLKRHGSNFLAVRNAADSAYNNLRLEGLQTFGVADQAGVSMFTMSSPTITIADAKDIAVGTTTGTKIGTATGQKIGFYNATPVIQGASIADVNSSTVNTTYDQAEVDVITDMRTKVNSLISRLEALGLIATV